jgi:ABC-type lipoprotein release transport system permease subunit
MAIKRFWVIAYRDLVRNRRRTLLTLLAVALGMMILVFMSGFIAGVIADGVRNNIRLNTGHIQLRDDTYEIEKLSLLSRDLLQDSEFLVAQAEAMSEVKSAAPVLWGSGVLSTVRESTGLQITGIDPADDFHAPIRDGIVAGEYLTADSRGQILIGKRLADDIGISPGQRVSLAMGGADGQVNEDIFTITGLFDTGIANYDQNTVIMPLAQAQAFSNSGNRASSIIIMLHNQEDTAATAAALQEAGIQVLTWESLNEILLTLMEQAGAFYYIMYIIVILVVAVLIANTLLMSVFERTRELGILASLGMKGRQIMLMVLFEAVILALIGVAAGLIMGAGLVAYLSRVGIEFSQEAMGSVEGLAIGARMYPAFSTSDAITLSLLMFFLVSLVSIYPAWYAARIEPVKALHAL